MSMAPEGILCSKSHEYLLENENNHSMKLFKLNPEESLLILSS